MCRLGAPNGRVRFLSAMAVATAHKCLTMLEQWSGEPPRNRTWNPQIKSRSRGPKWRRFVGISSPWCAECGNARQGDAARRNPAATAAAVGGGGRLVHCPHTRWVNPRGFGGHGHVPNAEQNKRFSPVLIGPILVGVGCSLTGVGPSAGTPTVTPGTVRHLTQDPSWPDVRR
jgi:hypothetical protein